MAVKRPAAEYVNGAVYVNQPGTPVYLKKDDVCRMTGKSRQWVERLTDQGVIDKEATTHGGMYEMHAVVKSYLMMIEAREDERDEDNEKSETLKKKSEAQLKQAKATIAALDAKERLGKMHRSEDVAAMTSDLIYAIRSALLALPGRLAVDVMEAKDSAEASEIIRAEVYTVMEELSNYKYDSAKYEERVRERLRLEASAEDEED